MPGLQPFWLACGSAVRFARRHGLLKTLRLAVSGASTLGVRGLIRRAAAENHAQEDDARYRETFVAAGFSRPGAGPAEAGHYISIVTAAFNTDPRWLQRCIDSVRAQSYPRWELCICDDGSTRTETVDLLRALADDRRVKVIRSSVNGGIVQASNAALAIATGEFVGFLDHDDELAPEALADVAARLQDDSSIDVIYTDEDKIDETGAPSSPHFKPDWSPELLRSCMYVSHFTVMRRTLVRDLDGLRAGTDGAQDYDLALRAAAAGARIAHMPKVLYHWRMAPGSGAASQLGKPWAIDAGRRVLEEDARRRSIVAAGFSRPVETTVVSTEAAGHYRILRRATPRPAVAVIASNPGTQTLNVAAREARGDYLVLLDETARPVTAAWIEALLDVCQDSEVGAVAGIVVTKDDIIDSAGLVIGASGAILPAFRGEPRWAHGHRSNLLDVRNCAAVGTACLMTRRDVFERLGGVDGARWPRTWSVDYSLKARREGLRIAVTPNAVFQRDAREEFPDDETARLREVWGEWLTQDPYYNPNFDQRQATFRLPPS